MKGSTFKTAALSLLIGCLLSSAATYWVLKPAMVYVDDPAMLPLSDLFVLWVCAAIAISLLAFSIFLISAQRKVNKKDGVRGKAGEKAGYFLQVLSIPVIALTAYGFLSSRLLTGAGILLMCLGVFHCCWIKNKASIAFLLWGIALIILAVSLTSLGSSEIGWTELP